MYFGTDASERYRGVYSSIKPHVPAATGNRTESLIK
jgi:hypothetical protein